MLHVVSLPSCKVSFNHYSLQAPTAQKRVGIPCLEGAVMTSNLERLRWAVDFAAKPFREPTGVELERFFALEKGSQIVAVPDTDATIDELIQIHGAAGCAMSLLVDDGGGLMPRISVEKLVLPLKKASPRAKHRAPVLLVTGPVRDVFLEVLYHLFLTLPIDRIQRCPGCRSLFVKRGRQTHCTTECYDRTYWKSLPPEKVDQYRRAWYGGEKGMGWQRGARLQRIATAAKTGGLKTAQVRSLKTKKARQS
jgi:hypothetical protein